MDPVLYEWVVYSAITYITHSNTQHAYAVRHCEWRRPKAIVSVNVYKCGYTLETVPGLSSLSTAMHVTHIQDMQAKMSDYSIEYMDFLHLDLFKCVGKGLLAMALSRENLD